MNQEYIVTEKPETKFSPTCYWVYRKIGVDYYKRIIRLGSRGIIERGDLGTATREYFEKFTDKSIMVNYFNSFEEMIINFPQFL